jgi:hypothetical protein
MAPAANEYPGAISNTAMNAAAIDFSMMADMALVSSCFGSFQRNLSAPLVQGEASVTAPE